MLALPANVFNEVTSLDCFSAACRTATRYFGKIAPTFLSSATRIFENRISNILQVFKSISPSQVRQLKNNYQFDIDLHGLAYHFIFTFRKYVLQHKDVIIYFYLSLPSIAWTNLSDLCRSMTSPN